MKTIYIICFFSITCSGIQGQDRTLPYYEIPSYPENFTAGTVAARMIDGLGFRYYWATEGLRKEDLVHKPSPEARTSEETLTHIYEMSVTILNSTTFTPNVSQVEKPKLPFEEMRKSTLENLKAASNKLLTTEDVEMKDYKIIVKNDSNTKEYPFWNHINGPIADCLWHVGQIVSFRRSSGNPISEKINVFSGKVKD